MKDYMKINYDPFLKRQHEFKTTSTFSLYPLVKDFDSWCMEDLRRYWSGKPHKDIKLFSHYLEDRNIRMDYDTSKKIVSYINDMIRFAVNERLNNVKNS